MNQHITLYIAMSLDGFIADENDNLDFLNMVASDGEDYGYGKFYQTIDTVVLGRRTYEKVLTLVHQWPHEEKNTLVFGSTQIEKHPRIWQVSTIETLKKTLVDLNAKEVYCDGGAQLVNLLLKNKMIHRIVISVIPVLLGRGIRLFNDRESNDLLTLENCEAFKSGLVQMSYKVK